MIILAVTSFWEERLVKSISSLPRFPPPPQVFKTKGTNLKVPFEELKERGRRFLELLSEYVFVKIALDFIILYSS